MRRSAGLAVLGLFFVAVACGQDQGAEGGATAESAPVRNEEMRREVGAMYDSAQSAAGRSADAGSDLGSSTASTGGGGGGSLDVPGLSTQVIKTADIRIEVGRNDVRDAVQDAIALANRFQGFVVQSSVSDEGTGRADLVVRVPAIQFEQALDQLGRLGDVTDESVSGQDVSEEFVDLEARLRNARAQEAVLLRLMNESATVADTIRVQSELQGVQLDIERLRGRLRFLEDQTALSTIAVSIVEVTAPTPTNPFARAWTIAKDTTVSIVTAVILGTGFVLPVAGLAILALMLILPIWRRVKPRLQTD